MHVYIVNLLGKTHGKGVRKVMKQVAGDVDLSAKRLCVDGPVVGRDDLAKELKKDKGREPSLLG